MGISLYLVNRLRKMTDEEAKVYRENEDSTYEDYFVIHDHAGKYTPGEYLGVNHSRLNGGSCGFYASWMDKLAKAFGKTRKEVTRDDTFGLLLTTHGASGLLVEREIEILITEFNSYKGLIRDKFDDEEYTFYIDLESFLISASVTGSVIFFC